MSAVWRFSRFPIGSLLLEIVGTSGLSADAFMQALGYRNVQAGAAAFDAWVKTGDGPVEFIERLQESPFAAARDVMGYALQATRQMLREDEERAIAEAQAKARAEFRPFVEAVMERSMPMAIMGFMAASGWRRHKATMPVGFEDWDEARQQAAIAGVVCGLYAGSGYRPTPLGDVLWYRFVGALDAPPVFYGVDGTREPYPPTAAPCAPGDEVLFCSECQAGDDESFEWPLEEGEDPWADGEAPNAGDIPLTDDGRPEGW